MIRLRITPGMQPPGSILLLPRAWGRPMVVRIDDKATRTPSRYIQLTSSEQALSDFGIEIPANQFIEACPVKYSVEGRPPKYRGNPIRLTEQQIAEWRLEGVRR